MSTDGQLKVPNVVENLKLTLSRAHKRYR